MRKPSLIISSVGPCICSSSLLTVAMVVAMPLRRDERPADIIRFIWPMLSSLPATVTTSRLSAEEEALAAALAADVRVAGVALTVVARSSSSASSSSSSSSSSCGSSFHGCRRSLLVVSV